MSNKLGIFLAGGAVGAVAALLCAPRTGQEARTMVAEKVNEEHQLRRWRERPAGVPERRSSRPGGRLLRAG